MVTRLATTSNSSSIATRRLGISFDIREILTIRSALADADQVCYPFLRILRDRPPIRYFRDAPQRRGSLRMHALPEGDATRSVGLPALLT